MSAQTIIDVTQANPSPFPLSFDGSTVRFQFALFSMLSMSILGSLLFSWMATEMWRGRKDAFPWEPLFGVRMVYLICSLGALLRCGPEAAYMLSYREASPEWMGLIMYVKRWIDGAWVVPGSGWMLIALLTYPALNSHLIVMSRRTPAQLRAVQPAWPKAMIKRLSFGLALLFVICLLISFAKSFAG